MKQTIPDKYRLFIMTLLKLVIIFIPILMVSLCIGIVASPFWFSFHLIGQFVGVQLSYIIMALLLVLVPILLILIISPKNQHKNNHKKIDKTTRIKLIVLSVIIAFSIVNLMAVVVLGQVSTTKREEFVNQNEGEDLETLVNKIDSFLKKNLKNAYKKPEGIFKIDGYVYSSIIDYEILKFYGLTRADIVLYQKWETCGPTAVVISQLLNDLGYESRRAWFIDWDHEWAEVKYNEEWVSFDPYLGYLKGIRDLNSRFPQATGVEFTFRNGTTIDMSLEHGYVENN